MGNLESKGETSHFDIHGDLKDLSFDSETKLLRDFLKDPLNIKLFDSRNNGSYNWLFVGADGKEIGKLSLKKESTLPFSLLSKIIQEGLSSERSGFGNLNEGQLGIVITDMSRISKSISELWEEQGNSMKETSGIYLFGNQTKDTTSSRSSEYEEEALVGKRLFQIIRNIQMNK